LKKGGYSALSGARKDSPVLHYDQVPFIFFQKRTSQVNIFHVILNNVPNGDLISREISKSKDTRPKLQIEMQKSLASFDP
jgi:tellurite resistance-related uncharacterized protein